MALRSPSHKSILPCSTPTSLPSLSTILNISPRYISLILDYTMDLANLISHPGPEPTMVKTKGAYSPPMQYSSYKPSEGITNSYFPSRTSFKRSPQPPPSPPVEDQPRYSLPSISTLIETADAAPMPDASMTSDLTLWDQS